MSSSPVACPVNGDAGHGEQGQLNPVDFPEPVLGNLIYESATTFSIVPQTETRIGTTVAS